jgi:hypothetical protein
VSERFQQGRQNRLIGRRHGLQGIRCSPLQVPVLLSQSPNDVGYEGLRCRPEFADQVADALAMGSEYPPHGRDNGFGATFDAP